MLGISFLAHYLTARPTTRSRRTTLKKAVEDDRPVPPRFSFNKAQMIVHALEASGTDVDAMVKALAGYSFEGVRRHHHGKGGDHAVLQFSMFQTKLTGSGNPTCRHDHGEGPQAG